MCTFGCNKTADFSTSGAGQQRQSLATDAEVKLHSKAYLFITEGVPDGESIIFKRISGFHAGPCLLIFRSKFLSVVHHAVNVLFGQAALFILDGDFVGFACIEQSASYPGQSSFDWADVNVSNHCQLQLISPQVTSLHEQGQGRWPRQ